MQKHELSANNQSKTDIFMQISLNSYIQQYIVGYLDGV